MIDIDAASLTGCWAPSRCGLYQKGRRRPLIAAILLMTVASILYTLTPSVEVMMAARFLQGFAGGWAMVISRAAIVDLVHRGPRRRTSAG
jgi:MFS family permease